MRPAARRSACSTRPWSVADAAPVGPVKLVILPRTRLGLGRAGLRRHLETVHGPMVVAEPAVSGGFTGYVHHYAQDLAGLPLLDDRDAVTVIRFAEPAAMAASKASEAYRLRVGPDEDNFRERDGSIALFAAERVVASGADDALAKLLVFRAARGVDIERWALALAAIAARDDVHGVVTNLARVVEGDFPFTQFDEIGLAAGADPTVIAGVLADLAEPVLAPAATRHLLVEPVRFI